MFQLLSYITIEMSNINRRSYIHRFLSKYKMSETLTKRVRETLDNEVPQIENHGGEFEIDHADEEDGVVELSLAGACSTCVIAPMTIETIENNLPDMVDGLDQVVVQTEDSSGSTMTVPDKTKRMEESEEYDAYQPPHQGDRHL